jgi:SprT protein
MHVSADLKKRVEAEIADGLEKARKKWPHLTFPAPTISYDLRGTTAGTADYRKWHIRLNAAIMIHQPDAFIARTPKHELAHLLNDKVYPEAHKTSINYFHSSGRVRRTKREVHGPRWQHCMRVIGIMDPTRCHNYDVSTARKGGSYQYSCPACGKEYSVGPKVHAKIQRGATYNCRCRRIGSKLTADRWNKTGSVVKTVQTVKTTVVQKPTKVGSKLEQCYNYYKQYVGRDKQLVMAVFVNEVGMTTAGASTYFYKCKELYQRGV